MHRSGSPEARSSRGDVADEEECELQQLTVVITQVLALGDGLIKPLRVNTGEQRSDIGMRIAGLVLAPVQGLPVLMETLGESRGAHHRPERLTKEQLHHMVSTCEVEQIFGGCCSMRTHDSFFGPVLELVVSNDKPITRSVSSHSSNAL